MDEDRRASTHPASTRSWPRARHAGTSPGDRSAADMRVRRFRIAARNAARGASEGGARRPRCDVHTSVALERESNPRRRYQNTDARPLSHPMTCRNRTGYPRDVLAALPIELTSCETISIASGIRHGNAARTGRGRNPVPQDVGRVSFRIGAFTQAPMRRAPSNRARARAWALNVHSDAKAGNKKPPEDESEGLRIPRRSG